MTSDEDYKKGFDIIKKRQEYNKQYYEKRKKQQPQPKNKSGRKAIEEITPERASETLEKYRLKCKNQNKTLKTPGEVKQEINRLFAKLKTMMPDNTQNIP